MESKPDTIKISTSHREEILTYSCGFICNR